MITVIGATGNNGSAVLRHLQAKGAPVRALIRNDAARDRLPEGSQTVIADIDDVASLTRALGGSDKAFLSAPFSPTMPQQIRNMVEAAKAAGVSHLVLLSGYGAGPEATNSTMRWLSEMEAAVTQSGLIYSIIRGATFMQNFLAHAGSIAADGAIYAPLGDTPQLLVDADDIGAVAAHVLTTDGHDGETYFVTGSEHLTHAEAAATLSEALGREVHFVNVPFEAAEQAMTDMGVPTPIVAALIELWKDMTVQQPPEPTDTVKRLLGRDPIRFTEFAKSRRTQFDATLEPTH